MRGVLPQPCLHTLMQSRYFAFRALITQRTGIDFVSCLHNCREFSQTSLVFISGYANTENVFYCLIIWLCGGTLCGYFCWSGWPRAYSELNPTPHLTPKYLFPTQWVSSPSPIYSFPLRPVRVPVHTAPWHTNYAIYDASLRHRNRAKITVCGQKPYPEWFSRTRNSAQCEPADTFHRSIVTLRSEDVSSIFLFT